ncbi:MAG: WecB/TagA/CpsF family glycosyltransferase [Phycisphaerae bacterium]
MPAPRARAPRPSRSEIPPAVDVLGLPVRLLTSAELADCLAGRAAQGLRTTVCYANAHTMNLAARNAAFRSILTEADLLYADGASVVWASRFASRRLPERMTAADWFDDFAARCAARGLSLYLLGGRNGVAHRAAERLRALHAGLRIVGSHHGFFEEADAPRLIAEINARQPDVLLVGLSSPRQECWLATHEAALRVPVRWCVGALLDYVAGAEPRAPAAFCRIGCEWLFRFLADPVGKWRRYLVGNPLFIWNTLRWRLRVKSKRGIAATGTSAG